MYRPLTYRTTEITSNYSFIQGGGECIRDLTFKLRGCSFLSEGWSFSLVEHTLWASQATLCFQIIALLRERTWRLVRCRVPLSHAWNDSEELFLYLNPKAMPCGGKKGRWAGANIIKNKEGAEAEAARRADTVRILSSTPSPWSPVHHHLP